MLTVTSYEIQNLKFSSRLAFLCTHQNFHLYSVSLNRSVEVLPRPIIWRLNPRITLTTPWPSLGTRVAPANWYPSEVWSSCLWFFSWLGLYSGTARAQYFYVLSVWLFQFCARIWFVPHRSWYRLLCSKLKNLQFPFAISIDVLLCIMHCNIALLTWVIGIIESMWFFDKNILICVN